MNCSCSPQRPHYDKPPDDGRPHWLGAVRSTGPVRARDVSPGLMAAFLVWFVLVTTFRLYTPAWDGIWVVGVGLVVAWGAARAVGR